ncbi:MAG: EAL domain-containing protein [Nitrospinae bacterium]|nr:EAL domain-containing protein [Nitrospinota bacterium]
MSEKKNHAVRMELILTGAVVTAMLFLALLAFHHFSWRAAMQENGPLLNGLTLARADIYKGALLVEEAAPAGSAETLKNAFTNFTDAKRHLRLSVKSVDSPDGAEVHDPAIKRRLAELDGKIEELSGAALGWWAVRGSADEKGASLKFAELLNSAQNDAAGLESALYELTRVELEWKNQQFGLVVGIWFITLVVGLGILYRIIRRQALAEDALLKSESRLSRAQKMARLGAWELDLGSGVYSVSEETLDIFGLGAGNGPLTREIMMARVHPDDKEAVEKARAQAEQNRSISMEYKIVRPDGSTGVVYEYGELEAARPGQAARLIGAVQDVTYLRQAEDLLLLATNVFANAIEGVLVTDPRGVIEFANPAATEITGYSQEELVGKTPRILKSDRHDNQFYKELWGALLKDGAWQGEIWNRRKNREAYPEKLTITAIKDMNGRITKFVSVFHDISQIKKSEEKIEYQAYHDALTALPNKVLFSDRLTQSIGYAHRTEKKLAVLFFGLDRLKNINETLGHNKGDILLQRAAQRLLNIVREGDTLARFGGDEFALIQEDIQTEQDAVKMILKILRAVSEPFDLEGHELYITTSAGGAIYPADGSDSPTLIKNAEIAMRRAKDSGRNTYQLYTSSMNVKSFEKLSLEADLRKAIERGGFLVHYQPKVSLATGEITGMEALARWNHPMRGLIPPAEFIPLAEETGLIAPIGEWVMETACEQNRRWREAGYKDLTIAVNLSAVQFRKKDLNRTIETILSRAGLEPAYLNIELTESVVMGEVDSAISILRKLKDMGVKISIDDFGTGYSSLSYLKKFPIDYLKIDRSFIKDVINDPDDAAIVSAIIHMAKRLELQVVAEGVETEEQLEFVRRNGCEEVQGYLYSPPKTAMELTRILAAGGLLRPTKLGAV